METGSEFGQGLRTWHPKPLCSMSDLRCRPAMSIGCQRNLGWRVLFDSLGPSTRTGGSASAVNGSFDNEFFEVDALSGVGVVSAQPRFVCTTADLPSGAAAGDAIRVDGTA